MIFAHTEFYYCSPDLIKDSQIYLSIEESKHLIQVMRHKIGDTVFVTDGIGHVFESEVIEVEKNCVILKINNTIDVENPFPNITFCIPILKSQDRFEFALEKCVELGITNFVVFSASKSHKRGAKIDRWNKIVLAAMKQSLHAHKPKIEIVNKLSDVTNGEKTNLIFDQLAESTLTTYLTDIDQTIPINFIFGPEAGLTDVEIDAVNNKVLIKLSNNRLRAETAIVSAASILSAQP